ncbi:glycosyltransferase [Quisquiliibacterium transsilvanicum]|uniref:Glycosyltransferase involved in cell wall biosynthesis n=1 Tax=Quisquiliibacterium transsilvanicum TaxID=1549638 RepID=A0A7W8HDT8_9BURK|nr:glycosyltransferase involved in cell wall biosynthesis [Quisquiliibacterium transsilvanicum]
MKILFHHRIASADGQFVHMTELTRALRTAGHEVLIVGPHLSEGSTLGETSGLIKRLKRMLPGAVYEVLEFLYSLAALCRLARAAIAFKPDAIYERYNLHLHAGRFVARALGVPLLLEVNAPLTVERAAYGGLKLKRFAAWSDRRIWGGADHVLPVTNALADYVRAAGVPEKRIIVIPNGVDLAMYPGGAEREAAKIHLGLSGRIVLGFVGFVRDWHGLPQIIDFVAQRRDLPLYLLIVGDGLDRARLEARIAELDIGDRARITGFVPRNEVPGYIAAFDVALQPAVTAWASPLKLFEYMAAGSAVIAPDAPNIREVLTHERDALLFDPANAEQLVESLRRLCDEPDLRARLGAEARRLVLDRPYTWEHNATVVAELVKRSRKRPAEPGTAGRRSEHP